jgi:putative phosphoesterase
MKIGVVSDTHSKALPASMLAAFKDVDFIIHAGDFCEDADYLAFAKIKEVKAVQGNMDGSNIRRRFPVKQILVCGSYRIGLYHGEGPPQTLLDKVKAQFKADKVDAVIFGHSHHPFNQIQGDVLYFNPGSPNDDIFAPYRSYGILHVTEKGITGELVKVHD